MTADIVVQRFTKKPPADKLADREGGYVVDRGCVWQKPYEVRKRVGGTT